MLALPIGILLGIVLAIIPGPVAVGAMRYSITNGRTAGFRYCLGSGMMDCCYCLAAVFATSVVVNSFSSFSDKHPILVFGIQIAVVLAIIVFGLLQFKEAKKGNRNSVEELHDNSNAMLNNFRNRGPFFVGIGISLTNLPSPTFLPSLAYFTLQVQNLDFFAITTINNCLLALGFGMGNFLWLSCVVKAITHYKSKFSGKFISVIYKFAGYTLLCFGGVLGYRILTITKWSEILGILLSL